MSETSRPRVDLGLSADVASWTTMRWSILHVGGEKWLYTIALGRSEKKRESHRRLAGQIRRLSTSSLIVFREPVWWMKITLFKSLVEDETMPLLQSCCFFLRLQEAMSEKSIWLNARTSSYSLAFLTPVCCVCVSVGTSSTWPSPSQWRRWIGHSGAKSYHPTG